MGEVISPFDNTQLYLDRGVEKGCRAMAVVVRGLREHQGWYDYSTELLYKTGIGTYRFNHRGHGCSEGERTYYGDSSELLDDTNVMVDMAIAENPDMSVFLIGHSMGGFTVVLYGAKYSDKKLRGVITSGALTVDNGKSIISVPRNLDVHTQLPNELGAGVCSVTEVMGWHDRGPCNTKVFTTGLCYALCDGIGRSVEKGKELRYPVLMLRGEKDGLVNVQGTYNFFKAVASINRQMNVYDGLFHETLSGYCKNEVTGDTIRRVENHIG